tara:strand:+ start:442 stop:678 length:237 start_codon:yes stop_codon:yes gene_type:complete
MGLYINRGTGKVSEIKDSIFDKLAGQGLMISYEVYVDIPKHIETVEQAVEEAIQEEEVQTKDIEKTNETFTKSKKNKS